MIVLHLSRWGVMVGHRNEWSPKGSAPRRARFLDVVMTAAVLLLAISGCGAPGDQRPQSGRQMATSSPSTKAAGGDVPFAQAYEEALKRVNEALDRRDRELLVPGHPDWIMEPQGWASMRFGPLVKEASNLAKVATDSDIAFLRERFLGVTSFVDYGPFYSVDARLAVLTLAGSTPPDRAARELGGLIKKEMPLAVFAMSLLPREISVPVLRGIAKDWRDSGSYGYINQLITDAVVLLTILGDKGDLAIVDAIDANDLLRHKFEDTAFHDYVVRMRERLSMADEGARNGQIREELVYWQCLRDRAPDRRTVMTLFRTAWRHNKEGVYLSRDFLHARLPERYAMAVAAVQRERSLVPELRAIAGKAEWPADDARFALGVMGNDAETQPADKAASDGD